MSYLKYIQSKQWEEMKIDIIAIRGMVCESCGNPLNEVAKTRLVHLTTERLYNEEPADVMLCCVRCSQIQRNKLNADYHRKIQQANFKKFAEKRNKKQANKFYGR